MSLHSIPPVAEEGVLDLRFVKYRPAADALPKILAAPRLTATGTPEEQADAYFYSLRDIAEVVGGFREGRTPLTARRFTEQEFVRGGEKVFQAAPEELRSPILAKLDHSQRRMAADWEPRQIGIRSHAAATARAARFQDGLDRLGLGSAREAFAEARSSREARTEAVAAVQAVRNR